MSILLPRMYATAHAAQPMTDKGLGFDPIARMAIETYRSSYNPLPTANVHEFRAFFSLPNYRYLYSEIVRQCKGKAPESSTLIETMFWAFQTVAPRSDEMDERREMFDAEMTMSYVKEMNGHVLERMTADVDTANMQADNYYKYRFEGPVNMTDDWGDYGVDTRTRWTGSRADMTYQLP